MATASRKVPTCPRIPGHAAAFGSAGPELVWPELAVTVGRGQRQAHVPACGTQDLHGRERR